MMRHYGKLQLCCSLLGSFLIQLILGSVYSFGTTGFNCDFDFPKNTTNSAAILAHCERRILNIFIFALFGTSSTMTLGGYIKDKIGLTFTILIGSFILNIGVFCATMTDSSDIWRFPITYGLITGLGAGIMNSTSLSASCKAFTNKGLIIGLVLSGFSLGPILFSFIMKLARLYDDPFNVLGVIYLLIQLISSFLIWISERPSITESNVNIYNAFGNEDSNDVKPHKLLFQYDFWIIWISFLLNAPAHIGMITLQKIIESVEPIKFRLNFSIYIFCFSEFSGRIFWGFLMDHFAYNNLLAIGTLGTTLIAIISYLGFHLPSPIKSEDLIFHNRLYNIIMIVNYLWLSVNASIFPSIIVKRFGQQYFDKNYGLLWTAYSFAGVVISVTLTTMDLKNLNLTISIVILAALQVLSFMLSQAYIGKNREIHLEICGFQLP